MFDKHVAQLIGSGSTINKSAFVSHGRTIYNAINSLIVNVGYYGIIYLAFKRGMFAENMMFIIGMFGCGMLVHMAASILMYRLEIIRTQTMPADCQKKAV